MKRLLVLLLLCVLPLAGCAKKTGTRIWWGANENFSVRLMLMEDSDGILPFDSREFYWERNDMHPIDLNRLDGGEYRGGTWAQKGDRLTLRFSDGDVITGLFKDQDIVLNMDGGILLRYVD